MIITGAVYISQLLRITHTLQYLSMWGNDIGDNGMAVISEALQHNKSLTTLKVAECGLSVKGSYCRCSMINVVIVTILKIYVTGLATYLCNKL